MGRKIVCLLMTLVLVLGLVACGDMSGSEPDSTPVFSDVENEEVPTTTTTEDENELDATPTTTTTTEAEEEETTKRTTTTTKKKTTAKTTKKTTKKSTTTTKKSTKKSTTTTKKPTTTTTKRPTTTTTTTTTTTKKTTTTTTKKPTTTTKKPTTTTAPQAKVYGAGETWRVDGEWEFTINSVEVTEACNRYSDAVGEQVVLIHYTYKNIGYQTSSSDSLIFYSWDFNVYDGEGEAAETYFCTHEKSPKECVVGTKCTASEAYMLPNDSKAITIAVEKYNSNIKEEKATFKVPVTEAPPEPEEDKLEGCTITVDNDLPETFSYSDSYPEKYTSSCSVTEVTFEVSGEDLYMYFSGRKTYDSRGSGQSDQCAISWKLYDDDTNTVIATGTAYTLSLAEGEGFVKTKDEAYDCITPGGNYRLLLLNTN